MLHWHMELPSKFTDIGDAEGKDRGISNGNSFTGHIRETLVRDIVPGQLLQYIPGLRPAQGDTGLRGSYIVYCNRAVVGQMFSDPIEIVLNEGCSRHKIKVIFSDSTDRKVALNSAPFVQHLGISDRANRSIHLVVGDSLEKGKCSRPFHLNLSERGLVNDPGLCPNGLVLLPYMLEPVWKPPSYN